MAAPDTYADGEKIKALKMALENNEREQQTLSARWDAIEAELRSIEKTSTG
jgi:hypothetical protein